MILAFGRTSRSACSLLLDHSKILFYGTADEMKQSCEPLVQEFLKDDQQEFHFVDEKGQNMPRWKRTASRRSEGLAFGTER